MFLRFLRRGLTFSLVVYLFCSPFLASVNSYQKQKFLAPVSKTVTPISRLFLEFLNKERKQPLVSSNKEVWRVVFKGLNSQDWPVQFEALKFFYRMVDLKNDRALKETVLDTLIDFFDDDVFYYQIENLSQDSLFWRNITLKYGEELFFKKFDSLFKKTNINFPNMVNLWNAHKQGKVKVKVKVKIEELFQIKEEVNKIVSYPLAEKISKLREEILPLTEGEETFYGFSDDEFSLYQLGKSMTGVRLGVNFGGAIIPFGPLFEDVFSGKEYIKKETLQFWNRLVVYPGIEAFFTGFLEDKENKLFIVSEWEQHEVESFCMTIPFLKRLTAHSQVEVLGRKEIAKKQEFNFKKKGFWNPQYLFNEKILDSDLVDAFWEEEKRFRIKDPSQLGLDFLIDDNPFLKNLLDQKSIIIVPRYRLEQNMVLPHLVEGSLNDLETGRQTSFWNDEMYGAAASELEEVVKTIIRKIRAERSKQKRYERNITANQLLEFAI